MFFWMQEPKDDKDEDFCQKVNDLLNKPFSDGVGRSTVRRGVALDSPGGSGGSMDLSSLGDADLQTISDLQSILSGIQGSGIEKEAPEAPVDLAYGITSEVLAPFLTNPEFVAKMKSHLPNVEEGDVANEISSTISSPQFQQALQIFSSGLQSGQLAPLIREFNLGDPAIAAAKAGDMKAFIKAIEKKMQEENVTEEGGDVDMTDV